MPVQLQQQQHVTQLILGHPPANAMTLALFESLSAQLKTLANDKNTRVVIIRGQGDKSFSAGFDLSEAASSGVVHRFAQEVCNQIEAFPKPVIAAINGYALGGGCEIALSCHIRMMIDQPKAVIGLPESNLGVLPVWGGTQRLPRLIGKAKALEMMCFSHKISAREAQRIGLVDYIFAPENFDEEVSAYAQALAKRPPLAVAAILRAMYQGEQEGLSKGLASELEEVVKLGTSKDAMEGIQAFFQKREPVFTGE